MQADRRISGKMFFWEDTKKRTYIIEKIQSKDKYICSQLFNTSFYQTTIRLRRLQEQEQKQEQEQEQDQEREQEQEQEQDKELEQEHVYSTHSVDCIGQRATI